MAVIQEGEAQQSISDVRQMNMKIADQSEYGCATVTKSRRTIRKQRLQRHANKTKNNNME